MINEKESEFWRQNSSFLDGNKFVFMNKPIVITKHTNKR